VRELLVVLSGLPLHDRRARYSRDVIDTPLNQTPDGAIAQLLLQFVE
jgi:hypothetical protein